MKALSSETIAGVRSLAAAVELVDIRPVQFLARATGAPPAEGEECTAQFSVDVRAARQEGESFVVLGRFGLRAIVDLDGHAYARFRYQAAARYRVAEGDLPADDVLAGFAGTNGLVHLWPYFRSFVHSACGEMGLRSLVVPPFRVQTSGNAHLGKIRAERR